MIWKASVPPECQSVIVYGKGAHGEMEEAWKEVRVKKEQGERSKDLVLITL